MERVVRRTALLAVVAAFGAYLVAGHMLHGPNDGMSSLHGAGICLLAVTLVGGVAAAVVARRRSLPRPRIVTPLPAAAQPPWQPSRLPARASPAWLQRFLC